MKLIWRGAVDISVAKIAALVPPLEPFVGKDMAAVTFKDTHLGFSAAADYINMGTTVMLLGHVDIGALTLEVGHIPYSSRILGMESEYVNGAIATAEIGPDSGNPIILRLSCAYLPSWP